MRASRRLGFRRKFVKTAGAIKPRYPVRMLAHSPHSRHIAAVVVSPARISVVVHPVEGFRRPHPSTRCASHSARLGVHQKRCARFPSLGLRGFPSPVGFAVAPPFSGRGAIVAPCARASQVAQSATLALRCVFRRLALARPLPRRGFPPAVLAVLLLRSVACASCAARCASRFPPCPAARCASRFPRSLRRGGGGRLRPAHKGRSLPTVSRVSPRHPSPFGDKVKGS